MRIDRLMRASNRAIDPMSWYSTSNYQLVLGVLTGVIGVLLIVLNHHAVDLAGQICALALALLAFPMLRSGGSVAIEEVRLATIVAPTLLSTASVIVSALSVDSSQLPQFAWWPQFATVAVLASSVSFCTPLAIVAITLVPTAALGVSAAMLWAPDGGVLAFEMVAAATALLVSVGVTGAVFTYRLTSAVTAWSRDEDHTAAEPEGAAPSAGPTDLDAELAAIVADAAAFVDRTVEAGQVGPEERERAVELAHLLRDRLVSRMNRSWLHDVDPAITVVDPNHRGEQLSLEQRVALRGLLERAMSVPEYRAGSMRVDIAIDGHGMTIVAIGLDLDLPEGRRVALLAPQLLRLRRAVSEFEWLRGRGVRLRFRVPPR